MNENERYLIELLKAELNGEAARELPRECDPEQIFALAEYHSVSGMALYALERNGTVIDGGLLEKWRQARDKAIVKDITQQAELEQLGESFAAAGIRYLPLKGSVLKQLYPQSDMRTMSDIDILIDGENAEGVRKILLEMGYTCEDYDKGVHDVYYMPPVMNIEIHRALFEEHGKEYAEVFSDPWGMSETGDGIVYRFGGDVFFAYLLAHAAAHCEDCGIGIRAIMDLYVYTEREKGVDIERAFEILEPTGKAEIARELYELSQIWFGEAAHTVKTERMERYILESGVHGTIENSAQNCIDKSGGKLRYVLKKLFPSFSFMRSQYPILKRFPLLLPIMWVIRIFQKLFGERRENAEKLRILMKK